MSLHAFPYNDNNGDREYDAESFSDWLKKFFTNGVFNGEMQVTAAGGMVVTVAEGTALVGGKTKDFDATNFTVATANSQYPRIDTIVMERNDTDRDFSLKYVQGQYSSATPSPTAPVRADGVYQLVLAQIYVDAGVTGITQADITDTRTDTDLCGWVVQAVQTVDFSEFTAQFEAYFEEFEEGNLAEFETWFDHMKDQLSEDAAGHLQDEVDAINSTITAMDELAYTSSDELNPNASESVAVLASGETQVSRWEKVSKMFKNIRYLLKTMGNTDISAIGDGTATGAISTINTHLTIYGVACSYQNVSLNSSSAITRMSDMVNINLVGQLTVNSVPFVEINIGNISGYTINHEHYFPILFNDGNSGYLHVYTNGNLSIETFSAESTSAIFYINATFGNY